MDGLSLNGTSAGGKDSNTFDFGSLDDSCDDELFAASDNTSTPEDNFFDSIVGALENILMDEVFLGIQQEFCETNCEHFSEDEENKMIYTSLFETYTEMIEGYIQKRLSSEIEGFSMDKFGAMLGERQDEITGDVFDMLMSFTEFEEFKDLMLSYKGQAGGGLGGGQLRGGAIDIDSCLGIVSKENLGAVGSGVLGLTGSPQKKSSKSSRDPLSPASREAKDAGVSP